MALVIIMASATPRLCGVNIVFPGQQLNSVSDNYFVEPHLRPAVQFNHSAEAPHACRLQSVGQKFRTDFFRLRIQKVRLQYGPAEAYCRTNASRWPLERPAQVRVNTIAVERRTQTNTANRTVKTKAMPCGGCSDHLHGLDRPFRRRHGEALHCLQHSDLVATILSCLKLHASP